MSPIIFPFKTTRFKNFGILIILGGVFFALLALLFMDDSIMMGFMGVVAVLLLLLGAYLFKQAFNSAPMIELNEKGIFYRQFPGFQPLFCSWEDAVSAKIDDAWGQQLIIIYSKNPQQIIDSVRGNFRLKNYAKTSRSMHGSPMAIQTTYLDGDTMEVFKVVFAEIEKRN